MAFENEIGEDLDPGDETRRYGHYIHVEAAEDLYAGEAVFIDTDGKAALTTSAGGNDVAGVAYIDADAGEDVTIKTNGPVLAQVESAAGQGDTVGSNSGAAGQGELSTDSDEYVVLRVGTKYDPRSDADDDYALVAQRP